jgi:hypothetical protein
MSSDRPLKKLFDEVPDIIESVPHVVSLKEADTGKLLAVSTPTALQFGITNPKDAIGLTIHELATQAHAESGQQLADMIARLDWQVRDKKEAAIEKHPVLSANGEVSYQQTTKYPMLGIHQKLLGIFTYSQDLKPMLHYSIPPLPYPAGNDPTHYCLLRNRRVFHQVAQRNAITHPAGQSRPLYAQGNRAAHGDVSPHRR